MPSLEQNVCGDRETSDPTSFEGRRLRSQALAEEGGVAMGSRF